MNILLLVVSYLIGAIPFSLVIGKLFLKIDVREHGSKNPGSTNAIRVMGRKFGVPVFILDVLKGGVVVLLVGLGVFDGINPFHPLIYGVAAILGHVYPVFLKFKGGKAVATSLGVFLFYAPIIGLTGALSFALSLVLIGWVSVSSTVGALSLLTVATLVYFIGPESEGIWMVLLGTRGMIEIPLVALFGNIVIISRHKPNYIRLKNGTEPKIKSHQKKVDQ